MNNSRVDIYDYIKGLLQESFENVNIYSKDVPLELTTDDTQAGFIVVRVGDYYDNSQFPEQAYGDVRVFIEAYVPLKSRGRFNKELFGMFENGINAIIRDEIMGNDNDTGYSIQSDGILSFDDRHDTNSNNSYDMFIKTFIVTVS